MILMTCEYCDWKLHTDDKDLIESFGGSCPCGYGAIIFIEAPNCVYIETEEIDEWRQEQELHMEHLAEEVE